MEATGEEEEGEEDGKEERIQVGEAITISKP